MCVSVCVCISVSVLEKYPGMEHHHFHCQHLYDFKGLHHLYDLKGL